MSIPQAETYQAELQPKEEEAAKLHAALTAQDKELIGSLQALRAAERAVAEKDAAAKGLKSELWNTKLKISKQQALLDTFAYDLFQVCRQTEEPFSFEGTAAKPFDAGWQPEMQFCSCPGVDSFDVQQLSRVGMAWMALLLYRAACRKQPIYSVISACMAVYNTKNCKGCCSDCCHTCSHGRTDNKTVAALL